MARRRRILVLLAIVLLPAAPALVAAGASKVFVTLRDTLSGPHASEGSLGGTVADPPRADAVAQPKPAFPVLADLARRRPSWAPAG